MKVSIVIPAHNNWGQTNELLVNLGRYTNADEIIVVDDMSTDPEMIRGLEWWRKSGTVEVMKTGSSKNVGFLRASNFGMKMAQMEIICLVSTDVIIETHLCNILNRILSENKKRLIGGTVYNGSTGWNQFGAQVFPYAEGWLLATTRDGWEELGYFDDRYAPNDFEDVDLSTTAIEKGFELYPLNNPMVRHIGGQSIGYNEQREEITKRNRSFFEAKWITWNSET